MVWSIVLKRGEDMNKKFMKSGSALMVAGLLATGAMGTMSSINSGVQSVQASAIHKEGNTQLYNGDGSITVVFVLYQGDNMMPTPISETTYENFYLGDDIDLSDIFPAGYKLSTIENSPADPWPFQSIVFTPDLGRGNGYVNILLENDPNSSKPGDNGSQTPSTPGDNTDNSGSTSDNGAGSDSSSSSSTDNSGSTSTPTENGSSDSSLNRSGSGLVAEDNSTNNSANASSNATGNDTTFQGDKKTLPATGDENKFSPVLSALGFVVVAIAGFLGFKVKKEN